MIEIIIVIGISLFSLFFSIISYICFKRKEKKIEEYYRKRETEIMAELELLKWKSEKYANYYGGNYTCDSNENIRYS